MKLGGGLVSFKQTQTDFGLLKSYACDEQRINPIMKAHSFSTNLLSCDSSVRRVYF